MSRQGARRSEDSASPDIPVEVGRAIGREATLVARGLGLDRARVRRILDRMARAFPERLRRFGTGRDGRALPIWSALGAPSLEEALRYLPTEQALTLFERADLVDLGDRENHVRRMIDGGLLRYTVEEQGVLVDRLVGELEQNRDSLIRTGTPAGPIRPPWIGLGLLYPDAALEPLGPSDSARLRAGRPTLHDLRLRVLRRLSAALRERRPEGLWDGRLRILTDALTVTDVDFYLRVERFLFGRDVRTGDVDPSRLPAGTSGVLGDLLEFIAFCEGELTIGRMDRAKRALGGLIDASSLRSYYQVVGQQWQADFDAALDQDVALDEAEEGFWWDFRDRLVDALENDFDDEVVIRFRTKRDKAAQLERDVVAYAEARAAELEVELPQPVSRPAEPPNRFQRRGDVWMLAYAGIEASLSDTKGLRYIARLLSRPGDPQRCLDLVAMGRPTAVTARAGWYAGMAADRLAAEGLRVDDRVEAQALLDRRAVQEYRAELRGLQADLDEAEGNADFERAAEIRNEIEALEDELRVAQGLAGRARSMPTEAERARKAVQMQITRTIRKIERVHPALAQHLMGNIETGAECTYRGDLADPWEI